MINSTSHLSPSSTLTARPKQNGNQIICPMMRVLSGPGANHADLKDLDFDPESLRATLKNFGVSASTSEMLIQDRFSNPAPLPARIFSSLA